MFGEKLTTIDKLKIHANICSSASLTFSCCLFCVRAAGVQMDPRKKGWKRKRVDLHFKSAVWGCEWVGLGKSIIDRDHLA